jgi:hypothetical protein
MSRKGKKTGKNHKLLNDFKKQPALREMFGKSALNSIFSGIEDEAEDRLELLDLVMNSIGKCAFVEVPCQPGESNAIEAYVVCALLNNRNYILINAEEMNSLKEVTDEILSQASDIYGSDKVAATEGKTDPERSHGILFLDILQRLELLGDPGLFLLIDGGERMRQFDKVAGQERMQADELRSLGFTLGVVSHTPPLAPSFVPKLDEIMWVAGRQKIFENVFGHKKS